jgi:polysaccharide export outer membrane protein
LIYYPLTAIKEVPLKLSPVKKLFIYSVLISLFFTSCKSTKDINYFPGIPDVTLKDNAPIKEPVIQVNDLLSIIVSSSNPEASALFNAPNESNNITVVATSSSNNTLTIGYLVNLNGDIQFPVLGLIHAAGLNKFELADYITKKINERKLLIDPIVTIRYLNFRVSVMGEVARPGVFTTPTEKLSILEALSFAGDITVFGKRSNVLLIRENDKGEKMVKHLDLTNQRTLSSPYYYLKSNDVIIVESNGGRLAREKNSQFVPIIFSVLSFLIVAVSQIKF